MSTQEPRPARSEADPTSTPRVAVVTGGARELGRATAVRLAERGYHIAIADLIDPTETANDVRAAGAHALAIECDVSVPSDVALAIAAVEAEFGRCDILVNNAAIFPRRAFAEVDLEFWRRVLDVNLTSVFLFCKAVSQTQSRFSRLKKAGFVSAQTLVVDGGLVRL